MLVNSKTKTSKTSLLVDPPGSGQRKNDIVIDLRTELSGDIETKQLTDNDEDEINRYEKACLTILNEEFARLESGEREKAGTNVINKVKPSIVEKEVQQAVEEEALVSLDLPRGTVVVKKIKPHIVDEKESHTSEDDNPVPQQDILLERTIVIQKVKPNIVNKQEPHFLEKDDPISQNTLARGTVVTKKVKPNIVEKNESRDDLLRRETLKDDSTSGFAVKEESSTKEGKTDSKKPSRVRQFSYPATGVQLTTKRGK